MTVPADDPWHRLRPLTAARIGLASAGSAIATAPLLQLRLAHARARDAVHASLDADALVAALGPLQVVDSAAADRSTFLLRPDLGRQLAPDTALPAVATVRPGVFVLADGLSARAVQEHAPRAPRGVAAAVAGVAHRRRLVHRAARPGWRWATPPLRRCRATAVAGV